MLLSYDRVLQLLSEGKSITKIAELADCNESDVIKIIKQTRELLAKHEKPLSKKKIIVKKKSNQPFSDSSGESIDDISIKNLFSGSELSAIPVESSLVMYTAGFSMENPGPSSIGIVICDNNNIQVGKLSALIGNYTKRYAVYSAIVRALKIAIYFQTKSLKIRTDSELVIQQINKGTKVDIYNINKLYIEISELKNKISSCLFENVSKNLNEKAVYIASKIFN